MYHVNRVKEYLDQQHVPYQHMVHRTAYTAQEVAAEEHIPGKMVAKTVIVRVDGRFAMAVVPATVRVDIGSLKSFLGAEEVRLANELEVTGLFAGRGVGGFAIFCWMGSSNPWINWTDSSSLYWRAISKASLMTTGGGVSRW